MNQEHDILRRKLFEESARLALPGKPTRTPQKLSDVEHGRLMSLASQLALENEADERNLAYEIVTRVLEITKGRIEGINLATEIILARLGNFPGQALARKRYKRTRGSEILRHPLLVLEAVARRVENTVESPSGQPLRLTDFQCRFLDALTESTTVSVSAPTSAGKSFILSVYIARLFRHHPTARVIYVVPTRALIRQVTHKITRDLAQAGLRRVSVRCVPIPATSTQQFDGLIYILTQERLVSLLSNDGGTDRVDALVVDEAQTISDGDRGIVLHSAIDATVARFPAAKVFFVSPLSKNPEYLPRTFGREGTHSCSWVELESTVSRNLILVRAVAQTPSLASFQAITSFGRIDLGQWDLGWSLRGPILARRAQFAKAITKSGESTIIYSNEPNHTERIAHELIKEEPEPHTVDPDIQDLIDFLVRHVHAQYGLINLLKHRVAFHYGHMPWIVKSRIEDLCGAGKLKFICCTSTLLQGVNLPARHIIIERPSRGSGAPMNRADFLNLAGRAGRALHEFHGNVWCLSPETWKSQPFEGKDLEEIKSAFEGLLSQQVNPIARTVRSEQSGGTGTDGVVALGKIFSEFTQSGRRISESKYLTNNNQASLFEIDQECAKIKVSLPAEVFVRNPTISPIRLQDLCDYMESANIEDLLPPVPFDRDAYTRIREIFRILHEYLGRKSSKSYVYHAYIACRWIRGHSLKSIIDDRIQHLKQKGQFRSVDDAVRSITETIEEEIRYTYVKYTRAYVDILKAILVRRGQSAAAEQVRSLHLVLECGTDVPVALSLISIGLSRTTALMLLRQMSRIGLPKDASPEQCLSKLRGVDLNKVDIPEICRAEIRGVIY